MLSTLLFFHLLAVVGLFTGKGIELMALVRVWRASTLAELRAACLNVPVVGPLMGISLVLLIVMGVSMIYVGGFGWSQGWIDVVLAITIVLAIVGPAVTGKRAEALHAMAARAGDGAITPAIDAARQDGALRFLPWLSFFELIAALYVMTTKPTLTLTIVIAIAAGCLAVVPSTMLRRQIAHTPTEADATV